MPRIPLFLNLWSLRRLAGRPLGLWLIALSLFGASWTYAVERPRELEGVGVDEFPGRMVDLHRVGFYDEVGKAVTLADFSHPGRPVLLALVYYECPHLCTLVLNGLLETLNHLDMNPGEQFEIVAVSINPEEKPPLAAKKKQQYLLSYHPAHLGSQSAMQKELGWHFLTADSQAVSALANEVGFRYRYDAASKQYGHTAVLFILSPQGKISRYIYGITYSAQTLKLALVEASEGKVGKMLDRFLLFCYHFDPSRNQFTLKAWPIIQGVLFVQVVGLTYFLWRMWRPRRPVS